MNYGMSDLIIHHGGCGNYLVQFYYGVPPIIISTHRVEIKIHAYQGDEAKCQNHLYHILKNL